jgi:hypothetical protein
MAQLDAQVTDQPGREVATRTIRSVFPFVDVVLPWIVARLLVVPVLIVNPPPVRGLRPGSLLEMDGGWFRLIALDWYDRHDGVGGIAEYPFFPLMPGLGGILMRLGVPSTVALAGLSWSGALLAMAGARLLAARHVGEGAARLTPWIIALAPGGLSLILGYSDSFYLAALIWALLAVDRRQWWLAGALAGIATASRPNGAIAAVAIVVVALGLRANRRQLAALVAPSIAFLAAWMVYLNWTTGDPILFWTAKAEWTETTLLEFLADPFQQRLATVHIALLVILLVPYLRRVRSQPPAWAVVVVLGVLPALALGVVGVARYAILAFPIPIAVADALSRRPRWMSIITLVASAAGLMVFARLVVTKSWVP